MDIPPLIDDPPPEDEFPLIIGAQAESADNVAMTANASEEDLMDFMIVPELKNTEALVVT